MALIHDGLRKQLPLKDFSPTSINRNCKQSFIRYATQPNLSGSFTRALKCNGNTQAHAQLGNTASQQQYSNNALQNAVILPVLARVSGQSTTHHKKCNLVMVSLQMHKIYLPGWCYSLRTKLRGEFVLLRLPGINSDCYDNYNDK